MSLADWEPADPVVTDPVRQDNDKRNNIQIYIRKLPSKLDKTSQYSYLVAILSNWVPDNWVYRLPSRAFVLSGRHRGIASLVFLHRGSASQRISAARMRIARLFASHRIAISGSTPHRHSHRIAACIARYGPLRWCHLQSICFCALTTHTPLIKGVAFHHLD